MRVRITKALAGSIDGIQLSRLSKGNVYDVNTSLACYLLSEGVAEPANHDEPPANNAAEHRTLDRTADMRSKPVNLPRSLAADRARSPRSRKKKHIFSLFAALFASTLPLLAQSSRPAEREIRIVGCVQWEQDYRRACNEGAGGALGTGTGVGNDFVLTMVKLEGSRKATAFRLGSYWDLECGIRALGFRCSSQSFMNFSPTDHAFISEIVRPAVPSMKPRRRT